MEIAIITGLSGSGKSEAIKVMEDLNYYCMDNIPPKLITKFIELSDSSTEQIKKVAIVVDVRSGNFLDDLVYELEKLKKRNINYNMLFLEASDQQIINRYKEARRPHPLNKNGLMLPGIKEERKRLKDIKDHSQHILDTTEMSVSELKENIELIFSKKLSKNDFPISINSFGFKNGPLLDGDIILDVRFLPNPYYIDNLRPKTGLDNEVKEYVFKWDETETFIRKNLNLLEFLIPLYIDEGRKQLVIGIGCTGGKHRSVAIVEEISKVLSKKGFNITLNHRDKYRW